VAHVELVDAHGCFVSTDGPLTSLLGVSDLVVVANQDAILVADRRRSAEVKRVVDTLRSKGRVEADSHARIHRPWGWYQVIDGGHEFQVKLTLKNGENGGSAALVLTREKDFPLTIGWVQQDGSALTMQTTDGEESVDARFDAAKGEIRGTMQIGGADVPLLLHKEVSR